MGSENSVDFITCYLLIHFITKAGLLELNTKSNLSPSQHLFGLYSIVPTSFPGCTLSFSLKHLVVISLFGCKQGDGCNRESKHLQL